ncbi:MAG: prenyltransferase/squalene oxidase repeat-containing protein [Pirellulaceae bacterium]
MSVSPPNSNPSSAHRSGLAPPVRNSSASYSGGSGPMGANESADALQADEDAPEGSQWARRWRSWSQLCRARGTPAFMVSLIFHTSLLLLLALLTLTSSGGSVRSFDFTAATSTIDQQPQAASLLLPSGDAPPPADIQDVDLGPPAGSSTSASGALSELLSVREASAAQTTESPWDQLLQATGNSLTASFTGSGVAGRQLDRRKQIALARGGTLESEAAVERALEWLAAHQQPNGGWSLVHDGGACQGRCPDNGCTDRFDPAATGLSLLAFLGGGYTHRDGKHRETVRRGVYFLQQIMEETPQGSSFLHQSERGMYNHGIAAFALCEAYQMTDDQELRKSAQGAVDFIVSAQNYQGGWGYLPKQPGDLTLTGWQIMALKSAYAAGLNVPPSTIIRIDPFLDSQQTASSFFYGYQKPGKSPTCTSIGLLMRMFRGMPNSHPTLLDGATFLSKSTRPASDAYFNYYATLLLFHIGGPFWEPWNNQMREHLIYSQEQTGHAAGSWYFEDPYGREGGRLYTTAMCAMTLEVYYRFAPIYQQADVKFEL